MTSTRVGVGSSRCKPELGASVARYCHLESLFLRPARLRFTQTGFFIFRDNLLIESRLIEARRYGRGRSKSKQRRFAGLPTVRQR